MDKKKTKQIREEFKQLESPNARLIDKQMEIASQISRYIRELGLNQKELADLADVGESQLSEILRGEANPTLKTLIKIEEALDKDIIVAPSFHKEEISKEGFASISMKNKAQYFGQVEEVTIIRSGTTWQVSPSDTNSIFKVASQDIEVSRAEIEENNVVALVG